MREQRIQNRVAEGSMTLPIAVVVTMMWWLLGASGTLVGSVIGMLLCSLCAYLILELNNENALIRVRSRMMATVYVALMGAMSFLHTFQSGHIVMVCMLVTYHVLFRSYQRADSTGWTFYGFAAISLASLFCSYLLYLVPVYLLLMVLYLQSLSLRTLFAALLGVILPYWLWAVYLFIEGRIDQFLRPLAMLLKLPAFDYSMVSVQQILSLAFVVLLSIISIAHFIATAFSDKIKVRMLYQFLIFNEVVLLAYVVLFPEQFNLLFMLFTVNSSTLISHYFTLSHGRVSNIVFISAVVMLVCLAVFNVWSPSVSFS